MKLGAPVSQADIALFPGDQLYVASEHFDHTHVSTRTHGTEE